MEERRALAKKRKIEELQCQPCVDYGDETVAMQMQYPSRNPWGPNPNFSPRRSEKEQLTSLNTLNASQTKILQLESSSKNAPQQLIHFYCEVCQVPCSCSLNYKNHLNEKHKVKLQELKFGRKDGDEDCEMENPKPRCELCNIWCVDANALKQHLAGKKHKKMQGKVATVEGDIGEELKCELCGIGYPSKDLLHLHFNGKKHQEQLRKDGQAGNGGDGAQNRGQKRCRWCGTWCIDKSGLQIHLREKNHFLNELEVKKRRWQDLIRDIEANSLNSH
ncbi:hypothetical protein ES332_D12G215000v1 [Gossypium tomentosum]|uniref:C2H2-type domain-containing protein n=1 Tax=Gossypium tomentosum TaxID=34277 RepID=A0A5D2ID04_GOSTO|nr:hypothetical protein ES332_D12G215000v1 [Gossypium tomentosum]